MKNTPRMLLYFNEKGRDTVMTTSYAPPKISPGTPQASPVRHTHLDVLRIFAAVSVLLLHVVTPYLTSYVNYGRPLWWITMYLSELTRTGVPLFFMISGFLLLSSPSTADFSSFYKKRFTKLLPPFLAWNVIYYLYARISGGLPLFDPEFFRQLFKTGTSYHLWYLYSIALLYLFLPFFKRIVDHTSGRALAFFFVLVLFQPTLKPFINTILSGHFYIRFAEDGIVGYFGYTLLGYLLGRYRLPKPARLTVYAAGILSFLLFPIVSGNAILQNGDYTWAGGYTLNHYLEAAALFVFAAEAFRNRTFERLHTLSSLTFSVYLMHVLVLDILTNGLDAVHDVITPSLWMTLLMLLSAIVCFLFAWLWRKGIQLLKKCRTH